MRLGKDAYSTADRRHLSGNDDTTKFLGGWIMKYTDEMVIEKLKAYVENHNIPYSFHFIDTLEKAKDVPSAFNNWSVFYNGVFQTVNQIDEKYVEKIQTS